MITLRLFNCKTVNSESLDHESYFHNRLALNEVAMNNRSLYRPSVVKVNFFSAFGDNFYFVCSLRYQAEYHAIICTRQSAIA